MSLTYRDYNRIDTTAEKGLLETAAAHNAGVFNALINATLDG